MTPNRLFALVAWWGFAAAAYAQPLTLFDAPQPAQHSTLRAQSCLITTKSCANLSKVPAGPCPVESKPCEQTGNLVAISAAPPRK